MSNSTFAVSSVITINGVQVTTTGNTSFDVSALVNALEGAITSPLVVAVSENFPGETANSSYSVSLSSIVAVSGGTTPYTYTVSGLPAGLTYASGLVKGTPTTAGTYSVHVLVQDASNPVQSASATVSLIVSAAVTPPPTGWGGGIVDGNGNLDPVWGGPPTPSNELAGAPGGNWSSNFSQTVGATAPDGGKALLLTQTGSFPIWLPHPMGVANYPMGNGIAANLTGYTKFSIDVCPTAVVSLHSCAFSVSGAGTFKGANTTVNDTAIAGVVPTGSNLPANVFTTIVVQLSQWGLPDSVASASMWIYKILFQIYVGSGNLYIRNAKFLP